MGYDLGRTILAACVVLAVLVAASAVPVPGFAPPPETGEAGVGTPDPGGDGPPTTGETPTATPGDPGEETTTATTTSDGTTTDEDPDPTPTPTPTPEPGTDDPDDEGAGAVLVLFLGWILALVGVLATVGLALFGVGMALGVVVVNRAAGQLVVEVAGYEFHVGRVFQGASRATMSYVLWLSTSTARLVDDLGAALRGLSSGVGPVVSALSAGGTTALTAVPRAVGAGLAGVTRAAGAGLLAVPAGLGSVLGSLGGPGEAGSTPTRDARDAAPVPPSDAGDERAPPESVEEAWARFVEGLAVRNPQSKTPGEIARVAVEGGLPADPVGRLTGVFREVRYGGFSPSEDRLKAALSALEEIRTGGEES